MKKLLRTILHALMINVFGVIYIAYRLGYLTEDILLSIGHSFERKEQCTYFDGKPYYYLVLSQAIMNFSIIRALAWL